MMKCHYDNQKKNQTNKNNNKKTKKQRKAKQHQLHILLIILHAHQKHIVAIYDMFTIIQCNQRYVMALMLNTYFPLYSSVI